MRNFLTKFKTYLPTKFKINQYLHLLRFTQPTGIFLLFLPCLFGIFLALKKLPDPDYFAVLSLIFLFLLGSIFMRSAGCIINDLFDQKFDEKVARTKKRPLAAKKVSRGEALILLVALLVSSFFVLLQFNFETILSGFFALTLVATYPLMKRLTYYPQIFLGLTFNFGILMGSLVFFSKITNQAMILYFSCAIWTVIYDTIYAYQDIEDDLKIGVKSTAIKFQKNPQEVLLLLVLIMFVGFVILGWIADFHFRFFAISLLSLMLLAQKIVTCNFKDQSNCLRVFKNNVWIGIFLLVAIILG